MTLPYYRRSDCRLCGSTDLTLVLKLKPTPPANAYVSMEELHKEQFYFPLELFFCKRCNHVQILDVVDPRILFENYVYVSGTSPVFVKHFENYAQYILANYSEAKGSFVIDIGSNDGTLLRFFQRAGCRVLGIDPAKKIAENAVNDGVETLPYFFNPEISDLIYKKYGSAAVITANNVFAHIDDFKGFVKGIRNLLSPNGIFVFEVSYLVDVLQKTLFDMIYHEHLAYHSVKPLISFFQANDMQLIEAVHVDAHGGSIRCIAQLNTGSHSVGTSVNEAVKLENKMQLDDVKTYIKFAQGIDERKHELKSLLTQLKEKGKTIVGFGAPAKATTLMHHFEIGPEIIDFIVDDNPLKQGLYSPGMHIPILSPKEIYKKKPDYLLLLAWNFAEAIMKKHDEFRNMGGHFIIPLPNLEVI